MSAKTYSYAELTNYTIFQCNQQYLEESDAHCRERWTDARRARRRRNIEGCFPAECAYMSNEDRIAYLLKQTDGDHANFIERLEDQTNAQLDQINALIHMGVQADRNLDPKFIYRSPSFTIGDPIIIDCSQQPDQPVPPILNAGDIPAWEAQPVVVEPPKPTIGEVVERQVSALHDEYDPKRDRKFLEVSVGAIKADLERSRERRLLADYEKREAARSLFLDGVREAVRPVEHAYHKPYPQYRQRPVEKPTRALVGLWSDLHAGKSTAHFNSEIAEARVAQVVEQTLALARKERTEAVVDTYHMLLLGDLCDGAMIYPSQTWHSDQNVLNQIFRTAAPILAAAIRDLAYHFAEVQITCVPGNHGRGQKGMHEEDNADNYLYETVRLMTEGVPDVNWKMNHHWFNIHDVLGTKILMVHGHQHKIAYSVPFYSLTRKALGWHSTMDAFDIECVGHFHTPNHINCNDINLVMNGAFVGSDDFALEVLASQCKPAQTVLIIDEKKGLAGRQVITLD